jgi:hypothetical protein
MKLVVFAASRLLKLLGRTGIPTHEMAWVIVTPDVARAVMETDQSIRPIK